MSLKPAHHNTPLPETKPAIDLTGECAGGDFGKARATVGADLRGSPSRQDAHAGTSVPCAGRQVRYHPLMPDATPTKHAHLHPSDLRALARLLTDATAGVTDLVEAVHIGVAPADKPNGVAPLTYRTIRSMTRFLGSGIDAALAQLTPLLGSRDASPERRLALAALNGVMGDYLSDSGNPLAETMTFRRDGAPLALTREALAAAYPSGDKLVVLVHGLCMNDLAWDAGGLGATLAGNLGYTPLALDYNSGRHISTNGRDLADHLEALIGAWPRPVTELVLIGHSMGGLVARSAGHAGAVAGHAWPARLRALVFLGAPHHGAPLERGGNWINVLMAATPYVAPFARLGQGRSAGITDLRHGNLLDEDWHGRDRFAHVPDSRTPMPLPPGVHCFAAAAMLGQSADSLRDRLVGDGLVPLDSALGRHADPARNLPFDETNSWIGYGMNHLDLLRRPEVAAQVEAWLAALQDEASRL